MDANCMLDDIGLSRSAYCTGSYLFSSSLFFIVLIVFCCIVLDSQGAIMI